MTRICTAQVSPKLTVFYLSDGPEVRRGAAAPAGADIRIQIADAVYGVVRRHSFGASGMCSVYANVGARVATKLLGIEYRVVYGSLYLDLGEYEFTYDCSNGGVRRGEFHSWFDAKHPDGRIEVVDLAAREYPLYVRDALPGVECPRFPPFIWAWGDQMPSGVKLTPDLEAWRFAVNDPGHAARCHLSDALANEALDEISAARSVPVEPGQRKVGRNESCPCDSKKKYKKCCGSGR